VTGAARHASATARYLPGTVTFNHDPEYWVFLLHKGPLDLPSDLLGVIYIDISNGIAAAGDDIRRELNDVI
jgi:hypothetical protein